MQNLGGQTKNIMVFSELAYSSVVISNFRAIIFEFHQFLFQFWKGICLSSKNISDNLVRQVRDGFRPQFY